MGGLMMLQRAGILPFLFAVSTSPAFSNISLSLSLSFSLSQGTNARMRRVSWLMAACLPCEAPMTRPPVRSERTTMLRLARPQMQESAPADAGTVGSRSWPGGLRSRRVLPPHLEREPEMGTFPINKKKKEKKRKEKKKNP